jgi:hypothetical protein
VFDLIMPATRDIDTIFISDFRCQGTCAGSCLSWPRYRTDRKGTLFPNYKLLITGNVGAGVGFWWSRGDDI